MKNTMICLLSLAFALFSPALFAQDAASEGASATETPATDAAPAAAPAPDAAPAEAPTETPAPEKAVETEPASQAKAPTPEGVENAREDLREAKEKAEKERAEIRKEKEQTAKENVLDTVRKRLRFDAEFQTVLHYQNDSNFDPTKPYYDKEGQSVGVLGTFLKPRLSLFPVDPIEIVWEMEVGLNLWGKNDPDRYETGRDDAFRLAFRELYTKGVFLDGRFGFKIGYQYLEDPSALFLGHWLGAASLFTDLDWARFTFTAAQMPDQTYEGVGLDANNFRHDTFAYGLRADFPLPNWKIAVAFYGLLDQQMVDHTLNLFAPGVKISADYGFARFGLDLDFQVGNMENGSTSGDEDTTAWALQAWGEFTAGAFRAEVNQLLLSPDDSHDRNASNHAFFYSGKSRSRTLLLSENEIRDMGFNLDERLAESRGKFFVIRPGYSLTDAAFSYDVKGFFVPTLIVGTGFVLEKDNAMGGQMVGVEMDLDLEFRYKEILSFHLVGGVLVPGRAAAVFVNDFDRDATENQYVFETSLSVYF